MTQLSPFWPHFLTTLQHRPYVFVFLFFFLVFGLIQLGPKRTLLFLISGWSIAFASEVSSIRNGFPYGDYQYVYENLKGELLLWGVPLWDSLSYTFLAYASYSTALLFRFSSLKTLMLSSLLMMGLDVIIDPLTALGDQWFLGRIYYYPHGGLYFAVPLSNFAGWALVAFCIVGAYQIIEKRLASTPSPPETLKNYLGFLLYSGVFLFNWSITLYLKLYSLALMDLGLFILLLFFLKNRLLPTKF
ncbi:MAG: carotenoid biosynthesis protein [Deltaproteobacteria bacterium]|nr:carotenoid biosynthesis protein [Deltaproteobacteria bacterium]